MDPFDLVVELSSLGAGHNVPDNDASNSSFRFYLGTNLNISGTNRAPGRDNPNKEGKSRSQSSCELHVDNDQLYYPLQEGERRVLEILPAMEGDVKSRLLSYKLNRQRNNHINGCNYRGIAVIYIV